MSTTMFTRRSILGLSAIAMTTIGMAACSSSNSSSDSTAASTADAVDTSELSGSIRFLTQGLQGTFDDYFNPLIEEFEAAHPGVSVEWTELTDVDDFDAQMVSDASTGTMPDVINVPSSTVMALSRAGYLSDIESQVPGIGDRFLPEVWDKLTFGQDGEHTCLPWYFGPFVVTYNKTVFEAAGLDSSTAPSTMEEYFEYAKTITEKTDNYAVYGNASWYIMSQWRGFGVQVMNDDNTEFTFASDEKAIEWLQNMADLYTAGGIDPDSITGDVNMMTAFSKGNLAFGNPAASFLRNLRNNAPEVYAVTSAGPEAVASGVKPLFSGQFIAVNKATENEALAVAFADFMTNKEQGLSWHQYGVDSGDAIVFPVVTEALNEILATLDESELTSDDAYTRAKAICIQEAAEAEAFMPEFYVTGQVQSALASNIALGITGSSTPAEALAAAQTEMNDLLATLLA